MTYSRNRVMRSLMRLSRILALTCLFSLGTTVTSWAQRVGDAVILESKNPRGVPVHPAPGDNRYVRWANGTTGTIEEIDDETGWIRVESLGNSGWIVSPYVSVLANEDVPVSEGIVAAEDNEQESIVVGTWNLEHFSHHGERGFPENTLNRPGPTYGPRTGADIAVIANVIRTNLFADILILNEVNGRHGQTTSAEMEELLEHLGSDWDYVLSQAGGNLRIAILHNSAVRREICKEFTVEELEVQGKDIFDRDPLACQFKVVRDGNDLNDLIVVGLHLASGQRLTGNHNMAMKILRHKLTESLQGNPFPSQERDIVIGGDINANRYDTYLEDFWTGPASATLRLRTLSPDNGEDYSPTRLVGVPLVPRSKIDYFLVWDVAGGVVADLVQNNVHVHTELLVMGTDAYRESLSDHLPVTVRIRISNDDD